MLLKLNSYFRGAYVGCKSATVKDTHVYIPLRMWNPVLHLVIASCGIDTLYISVWVFFICRLLLLPLLLLLPEPALGMCEVCGRTGPPILRGPPNFGWNFFIHCIMYYNRQMLSLWRPRHPQPKHKLHNWKITTLAEPVLVVTQTLAYLRKTLAHGVCHLSMFTWRHIDTPHPREVEWYEPLINF